MGLEDNEYPVVFAVDPLAGDDGMIGIEPLRSLLARLANTRERMNRTRATVMRHAAL
jgi:hypothetical protein